MLTQLKKVFDYKRYTLALVSVNASNYRRQRMIKSDLSFPNITKITKNHTIDNLCKYTAFKDNCDRASDVSNTVSMAAVGYLSRIKKLLQNVGECKTSKSSEVRYTQWSNILTQH